MAHRAHTPFTEMASERQRSPALDQKTVLFDRLESHGQTTYTSQSQKLMELDPRRLVDAEILNFADERPMSPIYRTEPITKPIPLQGDPDISVRTIQAGRLRFHGGTMINEPARRPGELAAKYAEQIATVTPAGKTWDSKGNEEAVIRTPRGPVKYSDLNSRMRKPKPKQKKTHKKFTSPAPDVEDEGVQACRDALRALFNAAPPEPLRDLRAPTQPEKKLERDGVQNYQEALKAIQDKARPVTTQASMALPPSTRPKKKSKILGKPERRETLLPEETPQRSDPLYKWAKFGRVGYDYHKPTASELAKVNPVPKKPSPLSRVHNAEPEDSATSPNSPSYSPRLRPGQAAIAGPSSSDHPGLTCHPLPVDKTLTTKQNLIPRFRPLPHAGDPELRIFRREAPTELDMEITDWRISPEQRDLTYKLEFENADSRPL